MPAKTMMFVTTLAVVCAFAQDVSRVVATINGDPRFEMGFNWQVSDDDDDQSLEIIEGSCADNDTQDECFSSPAFSEAAAVTSYADPKYYAAKAKAAGLTPGTLYSYRVGSAAGGWSPTGTFKTAPNGKTDFSFIYTVDPQGQSPGDFKLSGRVADHAVEELGKKGLTFWLMGGDHINSLESPERDTLHRDDQWDHYFQSQQAAFLQIPYAPLIGNHEVPAPPDVPTYGPTFYYERMFNMELNANRTDARKLDPAPQEDGGVYSFVYGDALFLVLNFESDYNQYDAIKEWMKSEIDFHEAEHGRKFRWRIAVSHRGIYSGGSGHHEGTLYPPDMAEIRRNMAPVFQELSIDLAFHGHNHVYEVIGPVIIDDPEEYAVSGTGHRVDVDRDISGRKAVSSSVSATKFTGGIYDVTEGTLYFSNSKSGAKAVYNPITTSSNKYLKLFTGKYHNSGKTNGVYSIIDVTDDDITVRSYTMTVTGSPVPYDEFRVTKVGSYTGTRGGGGLRRCPAPAYRS